MTSAWEKTSYGVYFAGQNVFYILIFLFLITFLTDVGIPAGTVAVIVVIVKVWAAVSDPIFGGIIDKVKFKKGKFIPWLRISLAAVPLTTILLFAIPPGMPLGGKITWALIGYILWGSAYTFCDVPAFGLVTTMTSEIPERTTLMSIGRMAANAAGAAVTVSLPWLREWLNGWQLTAVVLSVVGFALMTPICFAGKERVTPREASNSVSIKALWSYLKQNNYLRIYYIAMVISQGLAVSSALNMYVVRHNLGDERLLTPLAIVTLVPVVVVAMLLPMITKHVDKFYLYFWSCAIGAVGSIGFYFVGWKSLPILFIGLALRSIVVAFQAVLMFMFTPDCLEYGMYKTGVPAAGISFSIQTFSVKLSAALAAGIGAAMLGWIGFVEGEGAAQVAGFDQRLWFIYMIVPAVGMLASLPVLLRYKLRDKDVQIMASFNAGEITREQADAQLGGKFS
jgi:sugar (glycoside-pentoside-hexuronide) transporter